MRSRVSIVIRLPSRNRCTSLPSFTARRPKVDSAMSAWRQNSEIWLRIWSFFMGSRAWAGLVGSGWWRGCPTIICPSLGMRADTLVGSALGALGKVYLAQRRALVRDTRLWTRGERKLPPPRLARDIHRELQLGPL